MNRDIPEAEPSLRLRDIGHSYANGSLVTAVLDGVNVTITPGSMTALVGASGSGKSTLLSIMGLLLHPTKGTVVVNGMDVTAASPRQRAGIRSSALGFVFQSFHLIDHKTVLENVYLHSSYSKAAVDRLWAETVLERVGLSHRLHAFPPTLSGGELQRCAVARALYSNAPFILCDEPTGNLDAENTAAVMDLLSEVSSDRAVVVITHDGEVAARADHSYVVEAGTVRPSPA